MESFHVHLDKEVLVFSAAHFITFNGNICERIHGHNWRVRCDVHDPLDENRYVIDFIALRDSLREIVEGLDHHVLLPASHAQIKVTSNETEVEVRFEEKRWVFPNEDCVILPVVNTTAEEIAAWISKQLRDKLLSTKGQLPQKIRVGVDENYGQWAVHTWTRD